MIAYSFLSDNANKDQMRAYRHYQLLQAAIFAVSGLAGSDDALDIVSCLSRRGDCSAERSSLAL